MLSTAYSFAVIVSGNLQSGAGVVQSVQRLTTDWTTGVRSQTEAEDFSFSLCDQTRDADHSPPSSVEVENE
jgi:hypothetical protein